jgi:hypothetical protein
MSRSRLMLGIGIGALALAVGSASLAAAATARAQGGAIQIWITPNPAGTGGGKILITGAIGDYGVGQNVDASGMPDRKGTYKKLILKSGTIVINTTKFLTAEHNTNPSSFNKANCSAVVHVSAPTPIVDGTGTYAGISGMLDLSADDAVIFPKTPKGVCNMSNNANPLSFYLTVSGTGTMTYR